MDPVIAPETPAVDTSQPAVDTPAPVSETPAVETPAGPDNVEMYQDIVARYNEDPTLQMTDKESEIYLEVQDKINSKTIPEPTPKKLESKESTPDKKPEGDTPPKKEEPKDTPDDTDKPEAEPEAEKPIEIGDSAVDSTMESMKKVGAKDITELPGKIEELIRNRDKSGGQLGSENAALKTKVSEMEAEKNNHMAWLRALKAGDQVAIDYLLKDVGYVPKGSAPVQTPEGAESAPGEIGDSEDYIDNVLAKEVKGQVGELKKVIQEQGELIKQLTTRDKVRDDEALTTRATATHVDDVVALVTSPENQKVYGLTAIEARGLAEYYFGTEQKNNPINPKFQKVHELISFAYENQYPTLEAAHIVNFHKTGEFAKQLVNATKNGQQDFTPSQNSENSDKQSRGNNNIPDPTITEDDVIKMASGAFDEIPEEWTDDQGNLDPKKVPDRFHTLAFGRAKPK